MNIRLFRITKSLRMKSTISIIFSFLLGFGVTAFLITSWITKELERYHEIKSKLTYVSIFNEIEKRMESKNIKGIPVDLDFFRSLNTVKELRIFNLEGNEVFVREKGLPDPMVQEALMTGSPTHFRKEINKESVFSYIVPIENRSQCQVCHRKNKELLGVVLISLSMEGMIQEIAHQKQKHAIILVLIAIAIGAFSIIKANRLFLRPLSSLQKGTKSVEEGQFGYQIPVESMDEIGRLTDSFNHMSRTLAINYKKIEALASFPEKSPNPIIECNEDCNITYINPAALSLLSKLGLEETAILPINLCSILQDSKVKKQETSYQEARVGEIVLGEHIHIMPDTDTIRIYAYDITDHKRLEEQLYHSQKMDAIGQLAGGIAHDFNNLLTIITGYGNFLQRDINKDNPLRTDLDQILVSSGKAANLTKSLLALSRKQIINPRPVNLNEIVKSIEKLLSRIIGEDIEFKTILAGEDLTIMADSGQMEQVLLNLCTNASDAMPHGGVLTISTEIMELDNKYIEAHGYGEPGRYALISVTDTGMGMDEKTRKRIFEPFFTTKELGRGTGLGLAVVYGIIKQHNGYINVYSEPNKGTTFRIYLPVIRSASEEIRLPEITTPAKGSETVLLAEDNEEVRKLTKKVLEESGYMVIEAVDGEDAIDKFMENKDEIQFLLLDVVMPKRNGKEVYEEIKKIRPDIKTLFISGYPADIINKNGIHRERLNLISKPVSPNELLRKVREVLDIKVSGSWDCNT